MVQYIDKSAVVAKIDELSNDKFQCSSYDEATGFQNALKLVKDFIDTLEVKEVDIEKETENYLSTYWPEEKELHPFLGHMAKHFFELGLKAQKGE